MKQLRRSVQRRSPALLAVAAFVGAVAPIAVPSSAVGQSLPSCDWTVSWTSCSVELQVPVDGGPAVPGSPGEPGRPGGPDAPASPGTPAVTCEWRDVPDSAARYMRDIFPEAPPDAVFQYQECSGPGWLPGLGAESTRWIAPGTPGGGGGQEPPSAATVAGWLLATVEATLLEPSVVTSPPQSMPATVHVPSFVAVSNWQGPLSESMCVLGGCVSISADPTLQFDPGEPGSPVITCSPPGTLFDRRLSGPEPRDQAAPEGACAYAYRRLTTGDDGPDTPDQPPAVGECDHRRESPTEIPDRPDAWDVEVSIVWDVHWEQTAGGSASGTFDAVRRCTPFAREVSEVGTVLTDVSPRER